mmetsp:Transcript_6716/g.13560  ORF Transcript_6716/g.13560 Transcript_6716/m.13560 type:complete len:198 (+) Transcript_6716:34-627(+)
MFNAKVINIFSITLVFLATLFFIAGCAGNENQDGNGVPWIISDKNSVLAYFGLSDVYIDTNGGNVRINYDSNCSADWCHDCDEQGQATLAMMIFATVAAIASLIMMLLPFITNRASGLELAVVVCNIIAAITSLIAILVFMGGCKNEIEDSDNSGAFDLEWGAGSVLTLIGMVFMWFIVIFQLTGMCGSRRVAVIAH